MKFQSCLDDCGMIDTGFNGAKYTWSNLRQITKLIQEKLDRSFCNASWRQLYLEANTRHLTRVNSNHCPILVELEKKLALNLLKPFHFLPCWLSHPGFPDVVRDSWRNSQPLLNAINKFTSTAKIWNTNVFGNIFTRKKRITVRLKGIQNANSVRPSQFLIDFEKELRKEYAEIQEIEEEF